MQRVFSLDLALSVLISALFVAAYLLLGLFDLTGFLTGDPAVRPLFNRYLLGQAIGVLPLMLGNSFSSFLLVENRGKRTLTAASASTAPTSPTSSTGPSRPWSSSAAPG